MTRLQALQKAVGDALDAALSQLSPPVPVYDHVPAGQSYPFVEIGRWMTTPANLVAERMTEAMVTITVWSDKRGQGQVLQLLDVIDDALDDVTLTTTVGTVVRCDRERADTALDGDGLTYTGTAIYTILLQH